MPRKPKKPCKYPGCARLTDGTYCEEHERVARQNYERFARGYDTHERYGGAWRKIRARYLAEHPLCEKCAANGRYVKASLVHHVKPIADGGTHDAENLMSLCVACHEKMHRRGRNA